MSLKQQQNGNPDYPERGSFKEPVYFTSPIVIKNIKSDSRPNGWAHPMWDTMSEIEKNQIIKSRDSKLFPYWEWEFRKFKNCDENYTGPINPKGETGMIGRGLLGKYGPNYAADPIVTRMNNGILEMVAIQRSDTKEWAIPGGMVEKGMSVSQTLQKEFSEEALGNYIKSNEKSGQSDFDFEEYVIKLNKFTEEMDKLFSEGTVIYEGWVDDPRNTDWAWMETTAKHFHISDDSVLHDIELRAASDAVGVKWLPLTDESIKTLYASHGDFVKRVMENIKNI
jgi:hypothetical protein